MHVQQTQVLVVRELDGSAFTGSVAGEVELGWDHRGDGPKACHHAEDPTLEDRTPGRVVSELEIEDEDNAAVITKIELLFPPATG